MSTTGDAPTHKPDWRLTNELRLYRARPWHKQRLQQCWEDRASTEAWAPREWRDVPAVDDGM